MKASQNDRWEGYVILGLFVFLVFCLVFEPYIILPAAVSWIGRWHPLLVHFPIVLLLAAIFFAVVKKSLPKPFLGITAIFALITAITGFFLSSDLPGKGMLLISHKWLGVALALVTALWYALYEVRLGNRLISVTLGLLLLGLVGSAGHYGAMVTHGEDYLDLPSADVYANIPENPLIYKDVVQRILKGNCMSCHNENKRKGELAMNTLEGLLKGGESGHTLRPGDIENSEIIRRLHLDPNEEDHMPPEGRSPLKSFEIRILERWIALGASDTLRLDQISHTESLYTLVQDLKAPDPMDKWGELPSLADSTIGRLSTNYRTIRRVAGNTDALSVNVYLPPQYNAEAVTGLAGLASNIVELDLSGLPLGADELDMVASCSNLEWLELDGTPIQDSDLIKLDGLSKLRMLKLYETEIGDEGIKMLNHLNKLAEIYLWDTGITDDGRAWLRKRYPDLSINTGISPEVLFQATDSLLPAAGQGNP